MSDMYLILRRRLSEVTSEKEWVVLGAEVMRDARKARGLSYESIAREIPVASKTYERWEKRGAVPVELVDKVAGLLRLEIERPEFKRTVTLDSEQDADPGQMDRIEASLADLLGLYHNLSDRFDDMRREQSQSDEG